MVGSHPARHVSAVVRHYLAGFSQHRVMFGLTPEEMECFWRISLAFERFEDDIRTPVGDLDLEWCISVAHHAMKLPEPGPNMYFSEGMRDWPTESDPAKPWQSMLRPAETRPRAVNLSRTLSGYPDARNTVLKTQCRR